MPDGGPLWRRIEVPGTAFSAHRGEWLASWSNASRPGCDRSAIRRRRAEAVSVLAEVRARNRRAPARPPPRHSTPDRRGEFWNPDRLRTSPLTGLRTRRPRAPAEELHRDQLRPRVVMAPPYLSATPLLPILGGKAAGTSHVSPRPVPARGDVEGISAASGGRATGLAPRVGPSAGRRTPRPARSRSWPRRSRASRTRSAPCPRPQSPGPRPEPGEDPDPMGREPVRSYALDVVSR